MRSFGYLAKLGMAGLWTLTPALVIELSDATRLDEATLRDVTTEVSRIFAQAGVPIEWRYPGTMPRGADAVVFLLDDLPKVLNDRFRRQAKLDAVMGYVLAEPGGPPGSIVYVSRASVERRARSSADEELALEILARALGRVGAHELAHKFFGAGHKSEGILKESFSRRDLTEAEAPELRFTARDAKRLRSTVAQRCFRKSSR